MNRSSRRGSGRLTLLTPVALVRVGLVRIGPASRMWIPAPRVEAGAANARRR
ncbi:MAG: hypothetical protein ACRELC_01220 [Gemmatimonadota bacterium]